MHAQRAEATSRECRGCALVLLAVCLSSFPVVAQERVLEFRSLSDFSRTAKVQLANGDEVAPADWPTFVIAVVDEERMPSGTLIPVTCTGAFVGRGVILTAAHCLDRGPGMPLTQQIVLEIGGQRLDGNCSVSPEYASAVQDQVWDFVKPRVPQDYAVCKLSIPAVMPTQLAAMQYEVVDASDSMSEGMSVLMTGYGCAGVAIYGSSVVTTEVDDKLRIKQATVSRMPSNATYSESFITILSRPQDQPALCPGDSGGPLLSGAHLYDAAAVRRIRAVNSRLEVEPSASPPSMVASKFAPIGTTSFAAFAGKWTKDTGRQICGVTALAATPPCRD